MSHRKCRKKDPPIRGSAHSGVHCGRIHKEPCHEEESDGEESDGQVWIHCWVHWTDVSDH